MSQIKITNTNEKCSALLGLVFEELPSVPDMVDHDLNSVNTSIAKRNVHFVSRDEFVRVCDAAGVTEEKLPLLGQIIERSGDWVFGIPKSCCCAV